MPETIAIRGSGQRLKKLREQLGRSPKEMARHLGTTGLKKSTIRLTITLKS